MFVMDLALILHDVGDRKVIGKAEDDFSIATNFLKELELPSETVEFVMHIIKNLSFSTTLNNGSINETTEFRIVQDADRLDALGAIGIARAFAFGGSRSRPLYNPAVSAQKFTTKKEYRQTKSSTLHHFEEKLFLLKDLMNTNTAKEIAAKRHEFTKNFYEQFLKEWEGAC